MISYVFVIRQTPINLGPCSQWCGATGVV